MRFMNASEIDCRVTQAADGLHRPANPVQRSRPAALRVAALTVAVVSMSLLGCATSGTTPDSSRSTGSGAADDATRGASDELVGSSGVRPYRPSRELPTVDVPDLDMRALLLLLADRRMYESFTVERALVSDAEAPAQLRRLLALALGRAGRPEGVEVLRGLLLDDDVEVRREAVFALGQLGNREAVDLLLHRMLVDNDRETGMLAVEALAKLAVPVLDVGDALGSLPEVELWSRLLPHLHRFRDEERLTLASLALERAERSLRPWAVYTLSRAPTAGTLPLLRARLEDGEPRTRAWIAEALGGAGDAADLDRLVPLLQPEVRAPGPVIQALRAGRRLVARGVAAPPESWVPWLLHWLVDGRPAVRLAAIEASAAWLGEPQLEPVLLALAEANAPVWQRAAALRTLARWRHPRASDLIVAAAASPESSLRAAVTEPARLVGLDAILELLASDAVGSVRAAVLEARLNALQVDPEAPDLDEVLQWSGLLLDAALEDADPVVRATALDALYRWPVLRVQRLVEAYDRATRDRIVEARLSAVRAIGARARALPTERGRAIEALERLAEGGERLVRRQAAVELLAMEITPPLPGPATGGQASFYAQVVRRTAQPWLAHLRTDLGTLTLELDCPLVPLTCLNFLQLAEQGFYDGLAFHQLTPDFIVQAGDPRGDGWGGPGYRIRDEVSRLRFERGTVGMALSTADAAGSQFFLTLSPQPQLEGAYTAFGRLREGDEILDLLAPGSRILGIDLEPVTVTPSSRRRR